MNLSPDPFPFEPERYELAEPIADLGDFDRRSFLKALGGGLVVLCLASAGGVLAQQRPRRGGGGGRPVPSALDAWVHVGRDGRVVAFSGKAEVGQNARTSLAQAVADELRIPVASVEVVLGDTDRVPFDAGTFGSRTTPAMVPQLRRASAEAREALIDLAAKRWGVGRDALVIEAGRVVDRAGGRSLGFGDLTGGEAIVREVSATAPTTPREGWTVAGCSEPKVNGRAFVTGAHLYASDVTRPGLLQGKVLRPPTYGAKLSSMDDREAKALPGVTVVREGDFVGVTAPEAEVANRALRALKPTWTKPEGKLAALTDANVFDHFREGAKAQLAPAADAPAAGGDATVSATYTAAYIAHAPLEPRAALAEWADGRLTVWTGTQRPFGVRGELATAFRLPEDRVRVIVPDTGAGYGGKHTGDAAVEAARLARAAGKPVKVVWTREEEFAWAYFRPAALIVTRGAARKDGTLTAWDFHNVNSGGSGLETPYTVQGRRIGFHPVDSPLRQGSYRALASTANHFARESLIDELADAVGVDPLEIRRKNLGEPRLRAVLDAAAERFGWAARDRAVGKGRGFGIACGTEKGGYVATVAEVEATSPGSVRVVRLTTAFECGAIINPDQLRNQVEGCLVMGLGGALFEAMRFAEGMVTNGRFSRYRVPRFKDVPPLDVVLVDRPDLPSAGAGEAPIIAIAPALASAVRQATGIRPRTLPFAADREA